MIEIIKKINKKIKVINKTFIEIEKHINSGDIYEGCDNKKNKKLGEKVKLLISHHHDFNGMYELLQAFHYSVSNYDTILYEEIEAKWHDILIYWFKIEDMAPQIYEPLVFDIDIDINCIKDFHQIMKVCRSIINRDIKGMNRFSLNYLNNKQKNLISLSDYRIIFDIKNEHNEKRKRIEEIQNFGEEALSYRDKRKMSVNNLDFESYIEHLKKLSEDFYTFKSFKSSKDDFLKENKDKILSQAFKFSFVNSINYTNSRTSQKEYYIEQIYSYIIEHKQEFGITIKKDDFEYIIANRKLPSDMNKIAWKGSPTDAFIFCKTLNIEISRFNRCFKLSSGKQLKTNSAGKNPQTDFAKFTRKLSIEFDSVI